MTEPLTDVSVTVARVIDGDGVPTISVAMSPGRPFDVLALLEQAKFYILQGLNR